MTKVDPLIRIERALSMTGGASSDFDLNPQYKPPEGRVLRPAAVLVAIQDGINGLEVVLTKRSSRLKHHPGQIAFPGGKQDDVDGGPIDAALREASEEVGLNPNSVDVMGTLNSHETVTGFIVTPVLARIKAPFVPVPEAGEVEEVFNVPLAHVTDPRQFSVQSRQWRGQTRYYYTVPYGPYYIWGATARILRGLTERIAQ
ncbi:CoA pyrophosphatase [Actibacterium lipolyticum]|uniref:Putative NUDIX hydrolase n=1 Tax=Actibacterium lipolyticum TaxID=1524263 RepID=A0A238KVZ0_9RHOB|nr:CoA pyrophosphatase [Actibacterium lipolyticum]SMX47024.1 putative NUDIX hydrolase [Actibacterium lipolyticum]